MNAQQEKLYPCPTCKKLTSIQPTNPDRPFCCERCKLIDLGAWANEEYKIPTKETVEDAVEEEDPSRDGPPSPSD